MDLLLEIVEGPGAGRQIALRGPVVLGRDESADVVLEDGQISRRHARVTPSGAGIVVEDLESTNGTFVNHDEVHAPVELAPGVPRESVLSNVSDAVRYTVQRDCGRPIDALTLTVDGR